MPPKISICIMARDEEARIRHALRSAKESGWCDELLVADTGSVDRTALIAEEEGARVAYHEWCDFTHNRKQMIADARNDWVFILDADERISPELAIEIAALPADWFERHPVTEIPRRNYLLGRHVRPWDPDLIRRLFQRHRSRHQEHVLHDSRIPLEGSLGRLSAAILHNADRDDFSDYFDGALYQTRSDVAALDKFNRGQRVGLLGLWLRPLAAFVKFYLLKGGFRDGAFGLLIAQKAAMGTQLKYARLWHLQQSQQSPKKDVANGR